MVSQQRAVSWYNINKQIAINLFWTFQFFKNNPTMQQFDDHILKSKRYTELRRQEEEAFVEAQAKQFGLPFIRLQGVTINPTALNLISEDEAKAAGIAAFEKKNKKVSVAARNPNNPTAKKVLDKMSEKWQIQLFIASHFSLEHAWERYQDRRETEAVKKGVLDIDPDEIEKLTKKFKTREDVAEHVKEIRSLNTANRISNTIESLFAGAMALGASDIHIEPEENNVRTRFRLDGVLHDVVELDLSIYKRLVSRIKLLAGVILNIHDEAQDGRFTFDMGEKNIEVRTSVIPGAAGESVVMRLLDPTVASFSMDDLGLNEQMYKVMSEELRRPNGLIITTGPTGSGKTTALYAFLRKAHRPEVKIITIEDPVEYKVDDIVQTQVGDDYSFASGLRAILRQDPDIIMVGEIRDHEVAETAIHAAQTGHLVFSTLHTNSAVGAFPRLIDIGVDYRMIGSSVNICLGQRLVRVLCEHCKKSRQTTPEETALIKKIMAGHPKPPKIGSEVTVYEPVGCSECSDTGFKGRQGVFEAIRMDKAVEEAIIRDPREHVILEAARAQGIPTMLEDGMEKVLQGRTSLDELERVVDFTDIRGAGEVKAEEKKEEDDDFTSHIV